MTTDALAESNMNVPQITGKYAEELASKLYYGSSVANPIDFLATGTAEQLGDILDYIENKFDNIDATAVIYGSPYLFDVSDIYRMVDAKKKTHKKPIFSILPSSYHTEPETELLFSLGRQAFDDEVAFAKALGKVCNHKLPTKEASLPQVDVPTIRNIIDTAPNGYLEPDKVQLLLDAAGIPRAKEIVVTTKEDAIKAADAIKYPLVMKVVGPIHKSDVGGVKLNIKDADIVLSNYFLELRRLKMHTGVLLQPMLSGN